MTTHTPGKAALRRRYRRRRRGLSAAEQTAHAEAVAGAVAERLNAATRVGIYAASDGEVDLRPVAEVCWQRGIEVALPVIEAGAMRFARYPEGEPLRRNRYGILEPAEPVHIRPSLVLAPLVAFDDRGRRLGRGGGYYDRYFALHPGIERVGVAHECQRAAPLPCGPQDMTISAVVTERGWQALPAG